MAGLLQVELVAADRIVWSGKAKMVVGRTTEGDLGVLPGHAPLLSVLVDGVVTIRTEGDGDVFAAADAGFLSVADNRVSILAERAELSTEINSNKVRQELEALEAGDNSEQAQAEIRRAQARLRAVEMAS